MCQVRSALPLTWSLCLFPCPIHNPSSTWHSQRDHNEATAFLCSIPPRVPILLRGKAKVLPQLQGPPWLGLPVLLFLSLLTSLSPSLYCRDNASMTSPQHGEHTPTSGPLHMLFLLCSFQSPFPKPPSPWLTPSCHFRSLRTLITP
jgi:hypothetical protein